MDLSTPSLQLEELLKYSYHVVSAVLPRNIALLVPICGKHIVESGMTTASTCSFVLVFALIEAARDRPNCKLPVTASCVARLDLDAEGVVS